MMNTAVEDEITSINAIYGPDVLGGAQSEPNTFILKIPSQTISLRLSFPELYPDAPPLILGPESVGPEWKKGEASSIADLAVNVLSNIYVPGEPCIYDLVEELQQKLEDLKETRSQDASENESKNEPQPGDKQEDHANLNGKEPPWVLSEVITEKKSVFVARAAAVSSPSEAKAFIDHLIATDKKVAKATHNMTAWRIQDPESPDVTFQDCDDDGETAAGGRLLHLLQLMQVWNVMVVVTRWYGGIHLGPDRFRLINSVARDALVRGGFVAQTAEKPTKTDRR